MEESPFRSASASPYGLRSSRMELYPLNLQRPRGWARLNRRSGPNQLAKPTLTRGFELAAFAAPWLPYIVQS